MSDKEKQEHTPTKIGVEGPLSGDVSVRHPFVLTGVDTKAIGFVYHRHWANRILTSVNAHDQLVAALEALEAMDDLVEKLWKAVPWGKTFDVPLQELNEAPPRAKRAIVRAREALIANK